MEKSLKGLEDKEDQKKAAAGAPAIRRRPILKRKWTYIDKRTAGGLLTMHLLALMAPFYFNWEAFLLAFGLYIITGLFGLSISYHRNLSHKSFKLPKWLEYTCAYIGLQMIQGDPIDWVSTHRHHHQYADTERDPHSPIQGFWYSYIPWIVDSYSVTEKVCPKNVRDFEEREAKQKQKPFSYFTEGLFLEGFVKLGRPNNVEDLQSQWFYRFLRKTYILHVIALGILLYSWGGLPFLFWGMGVRSVWFLHITYCVNTICHMWGSQPWNTGDQSKNNWVVALLIFGDGWHNNHHAFEYSARHGLEWWQLDVAWLVVLFLEAIGLATDVKYPSQHHIQKLAKKPTTTLEN